MLAARTTQCWFREALFHLADSSTLISFHRLLAPTFGSALKSDGAISFLINFVCVFVCVHKGD